MHIPLVMEIRTYEGSTMTAFKSPQGGYFLTAASEESQVSLWWEPEWTKAKLISYIQSTWGLNREEFDEDEFGKYDWFVTEDELGLAVVEIDWDGITLQCLVTE